VVDDQHQFAEQAQWKIRVLQAVHSQPRTKGTKRNGEVGLKVETTFLFEYPPTTRLLVSVLQICDDGVMDVFFLLFQKVKTDGVQRVRTQLVLPHQHL
jgi:hypothetical protein